MNFSDVMKLSTEQLLSEKAMTRFYIGLVVSENPLKIRIDNKLELEESDLVLMRQFRAEHYPTHEHVTVKHKHTVAAHGTQSASSPESHTHQITELQTSEQECSTVLTHELYYGLKKDEKVVLLRNEGGQEYLVLGRM